MSWLSAVAGVLLASCGGDFGQVLAESAQAPAMPAALVEVKPVTAGVGDAELWVTGTLLSRNDARIAAEVSGRLVAVAEIGDRLKAGDMLARVDDEALRLQLRADEADVKRRQARVDYLGKQLERLETLTEEQIAALHQLDDLSSQRLMAEQDLESARVARDRTRFLLERATLRAPFPGRLVERLAEPGGYVSVGDPVARLVNVDRVEARVRAPLGVAPLVHPDLEVEVKGGGLSRRGKVRTAVPVGDERSRMFEIRIHVGDSPWTVGSPLKVALPKVAGEGLAVPRDALVLRRGVTYVFIAEPEGTARRVEVKTGMGHGDSIRVEGDLALGESVIVRGAERLQPGQPVEIVSKP